MIIHQERGHNAPRRPAPRITWLALLALLALSPACGPGDGGREEIGTSTGSDAARRCPVTVDASGWRDFAGLAKRISAGGEVTRDELDALGEAPAFALWRESLAPNVPPSLRVGNWLAEAFRAELGLTGEGKVNADRRDFARSYRWSWDHRAEVDSLVAFCAEDGIACGILDRAAAWIPAERLPAALTLFFLPSKPEIRWHEGRIFVDTGVLVAGGPDQLQGQIAGLLYRNLGATDGTNPLEAEGGFAVAHTFRVLRNEAVASWIEALPFTYFRPDHYRLKKVTPIPERFFAATIRTVGIIDSELPALLDDPARLEAGGRELVRKIAAGGGFGEAGYGMAAVIAGRLGADRLAQAARTVPDFLAAYQEAALLNGDDRPHPGAAGYEAYESLPAFTPGVYADLHQLLTRVFATES